MADIPTVGLFHPFIIYIGIILTVRQQSTWSRLKLTLQFSRTNLSHTALAWFQYSVQTATKPYGILGQISLDNIIQLRLTRFHIGLHMSCGLRQLFDNAKA